MSKQFTLGKDERLKSRKLIEQLFKEGKSFVIAPFRVYYMISTAPSETTKPVNLQFGVGVSTKNFKKAVDRNRVKRVTKEAWRLQKLSLQQITKEQNKQLNVFLIYTSRDLPVYKEVNDKAGKILNKLGNIIAPIT